MKKLLISLAMMAIVASMLLAVTQTGTVIVTVTSEEGQALPGASVTINSDVMMGTRTQQTGPNGKTTFRNLAPGMYVVDVLMDSFKPGRANVRVLIQKTVKVAIPLELGEASEVVTVVQTAPIVDTGSNTVSQDFSFETSINHIPTDRHYNDLLGMAAGTHQGNNPNVYGASDDDNNYLVDGVSTTDPLTQTWSDQFNIDVIADVSAQSAGISAEYSLVQGAVLNIVTKSGSNEFSGIARFEFERVDWNDGDVNYPDASGDPTKQGFDNDDIYLTGGGPLVPDMFWWFLSYNDFGSYRDYQRHIDPINPSITQDATRPYVGHAFTAKGTVQISEDFKANVLYMESPVVINNLSYYYSWYWQEDTDVTQEQGSDVSLVANLSYILNEEMFIEGRWAHGERSLNVVPQEADGQYVFVTSESNGPTWYTYDNFWSWGSAQADYHTERDNDVYGGAFNWLLETDGLGYHDMKIGFEYTDNFTIRSSYWGGMTAEGAMGQWYDIQMIEGFNFNQYMQSPGWKYYHTYENPLPPAEFHNTFYSAYIQDSIELDENLTLNIGFRVDPNKLTNNQDVALVEPGIFDTLAPRLGFSYIIGEGFSVRGSYGRLYDLFDLSIAQDFNTYNTPRTDKHFIWDGTDWVQYASALTGATEWSHSIEDGFSQMFADEFTIGFDYQVSANFAVSLSGVWRQFKDGYCAEDLDNDTIVNYTNVETNANGNKWKEYMGATLRIVKRPTNDNLYMQLTWTMQSIEGYEWLSNGLNYAQTTRGDVYYHSPEFNNEMAEYWWGDLGYESMLGRAQVTYFLPNGIYFGANVSLDNNNKETSYQSIEGDFNGVTVNYDSVPNGKADMERLPWQLEFDLQIGFETAWDLPVDVPFFDDGLLFAVYLNIQNLFNDQVALNVQNNIDSSYYGEETAWQRARSLQLGFRIEL